MGTHNFDKNMNKVFVLVPCTIFCLFFTLSSCASGDHTSGSTSAPSKPKSLISDNLKAAVHTYSNPHSICRKFGKDLLKSWSLLSDGHLSTIGGYFQGLVDFNDKYRQAYAGSDTGFLRGKRLCQLGRLDSNAWLLEKLEKACSGIEGRRFTKVNAVNLIVELSAYVNKLECPFYLGVGSEDFGENVVAKFLGFKWPRKKYREARANSDIEKPSAMAIFLKFKQGKGHFSVKSLRQFANAFVEFLTKDGNRLGKYVNEMEVMKDVRQRMSHSSSHFMKSKWFKNTVNTIAEHFAKKMSEATDTLSMTKRSYWMGELVTATWETFRRLPYFHESGLVGDFLSSDLVKMFGLPLKPGSHFIMKPSDLSVSLQNEILNEFDLKLKKAFDETLNDMIRNEWPDSLKEDLKRVDYKFDLVIDATDNNYLNADLEEKVKKLKEVMRQLDNRSYGLNSIKAIVRNIFWKAMSAAAEKNHS